jgi:hypothetical protein
MGYKVKYSRKEKKELKKNKSLNQEKHPGNCWIDLRGIED